MSRPTPGPSAFEERAFRWLLRLHPREIRERYGEAMVDCFRGQFARRVSGGASRFAYGMGVGWDLVRSGAAARIEGLESARGRKTVAVGGATGGGALAACGALYCLCGLTPAVFGTTGAMLAADLYAHRAMLLAGSAGLLGVSVLVACEERRPRLWLPTMAGSLVWTLSLLAPRLVPLIHAH